MASLFTFSYTFVASRIYSLALQEQKVESQKEMETSSYSSYFGATVEERAENMASSTWSLRERMPSRRAPFRKLPETLEMTYLWDTSEEEDKDEESQDEDESEEESQEDEESEEESQYEDESEEESQDEDEESEEEEERVIVDGDIREDFELVFDKQRHRFMEKFSAISDSRNASKTIYCISQHFELNYPNYPVLYFIKLSGPIKQLKRKDDDLKAVSCSCAYFEKRGLACKHMVLFRILYDDTADDIATRVRRRRRRRS